MRGTFYRFGTDKCPDHDVLRCGDALVYGPGSYASGRIPGVGFDVYWTLGDGFDVYWTLGDGFDVYWWLLGGDA